MVGEETITQESQSMTGNNTRSRRPCHDDFGIIAPSLAPGPQPPPAGAQKPGSASGPLPCQLPQQAGPLIPADPKGWWSCNCFFHLRLRQSSHVHMASGDSQRYLSNGSIFPRCFQIFYNFED